MEYTVKVSTDFEAWLADIKDIKVKTTIIRRLRQVENGNFGDHKRLSADLYEMRIHLKPGYRIYYFLESNIVVFILAGGSKKSQSKDIEFAEKAITEIRANAVQDI